MGIPTTWTTATPEQVRDTLRRLVDRDGEELAPLSRMIGRPNGFLSRFLAGCPEKLRPKERLLLARYFGVDERELGAADDEGRASFVPGKRRTWLARPMGIASAHDHSDTGRPARHPR